MYIFTDVSKDRSASFSGSSNFSAGTLVLFLSKENFVKNYNKNNITGFKKIMFIDRGRWRVLVSTVMNFRVP